MPRGAGAAGALAALAIAGVAVFRPETSMERLLDTFPDSSTNSSSSLESLSAIIWSNRALWTASECLEASDTPVWMPAMTAPGGPSGSPVINPFPVATTTFPATSRKAAKRPPASLTVSAPVLAPPVAAPAACIETPATARCKRSLGDARCVLRGESSNCTVLLADVWMRLIYANYFEARHDTASRFGCARVCFWPILRVRSARHRRQREGEERAADTGNGARVRQTRHHSADTVRKRMVGA